ncbi:hypothetical protein N7492_005955 [Penicillium capsulatum]|uniref:AAA+ ATPase domain-containing protein n=1 Tax=Penicillium capsulatum TaxID=69766 RepID=A0A9W9IEB7_9EURO|nr:hypothetical protein N7492_005955 [Penicillium capsulatum]KAJ6134942.1 hypothetical protein N7512_000102 [Penicillium capsulatum]
MQARMIARKRVFIRRRHVTPVSARNLHLSPTRLSVPSQDPEDSPSTPGDRIDSRQSHTCDETDVKNGSGSSHDLDQPNKPVARPYGSAVRRAMRHKQSEKLEKTLPKPIIPQWFLGQNTICGRPDGPVNAQVQHRLQIAQSRPPRVTDETLETETVITSGGPGGSSTPEEPPESGDRYAVAEELWDELRASVKAGLRLPPSQFAKEPVAMKCHLMLQYPGKDGILFLDAVVKRLAHELNTDLITLDAQDIVQLLTEQDIAESGKTSAIRTLGYDVHRQPADLSEMDMEEEDDLDMPGYETPAMSRPRIITIESKKNPGDVPLPNWHQLRSIMSSLNSSPDQDPAQIAQEAEQRWSRILKEVLFSASRSAKPASDSTSESSKTSPDKPILSRDTIVNIQDFRRIQNTVEGAKVIATLQKLVQSQRQAGSRILLVGSVSEEIKPSSFSQESSKVLQHMFDDMSSKTILVTPSMEPNAVEKTFAEDQKKRTMDINIRHLQAMLLYRLNGTSDATKDSILASRAWPLDSSTISQSGIMDRVWSFHQVHWAASLALGCSEPGEPLGLEHIQRGFQLMDRSSQVTTDWLQKKSGKPSPASTSSSQDQRLGNLRKEADQYESKMLNGVIDAKSIKTTFDDVHVPSETIEALKTLISLSFIRPEAFTYGVLATDKIPGLLLYGPPGTGKTLLAKAVARESGATVLEVAGSDIYEMYVGEGEKNIKALFTLATKLSPCVVFIDEADAMFGSRTGSNNRSSHRDLINQFLREWDGISNASAFIMVATNRPFDLDDAVLRRLPRRILVDLPTEEDRLAILNIHLKDEQLDPSVDLADLARRLPLYSGSDLKNLSVAAALAAVREENEIAAQHKGEEPYQYPARRTLTKAHFDRGVEEISASISEDMPSLNAIRKFDEQYGDNKRRREKKKGHKGLGFASPAGDESIGDATDLARVR